MMINRRMRNYLEHISLLLDGVVKALINPPSQIASAKYNATSRSTRIKTIKTTVPNIPFVTNEDGDLIPGLLTYLMEGILPMLKVQKLGENV